MFATLTLVYMIATQKGIIHFEEIGPQEMKVFHHSKPYIAPAKSVFMQGFEELLAQVFTFEEFLKEFNSFSRWKAKTQNPLYQHFYTLENFTVQ